MRPLSFVWILLFSFGCASALASLEAFPDHLQPRRGERLRRLLALVPFATRSARGAALMTVGLAGLVDGVFPGFAVGLWLAVVALGYGTIVARRIESPEPGGRLIRVGHAAGTAAHATLGTAVLALAEGLWRGHASGALLLIVGLILLAAAKVDFVLRGAVNDMLELSGD
jgi:hypothetical protein